MPQTPNYNDGGLEYGSAVLTITPNADANPARSNAAPFNAVADAEFTFDDNSKDVEQTDQFAQYSGSFGIPMRKQGSCTIQLPAGRRAYAGDSFTVDVTGNDLINPTGSGSPTILQIQNASNPYQKD